MFSSSDSSLSDDDVIDDEHYKCAASDLCANINSHDWRSGMITKNTKGIKLCSDCQYHAHSNCFKKVSFVKSRQSRNLVCLACSLLNDGDGDPTVASRNPNNNVSKNNTV